MSIRKPTTSRKRARRVADHITRVSPGRTADSIVVHLLGRGRRPVAGVEISRAAFHRSYPATCRAIAGEPPYVELRDTRYKSGGREWWKFYVDQLLDRMRRGVIR